MDCYKEMYYKLFNRITDLIEELQSEDINDINEVVCELQTVQQEAEEIFLSYDPDDGSDGIWTA